MMWEKISTGDRILRQVFIKWSVAAKCGYSPINSQLLLPGSSLVTCHMSLESPKRRFWPAFGEEIVDSIRPPGATEKYNQRDEKHGCIFTVGRPKHATFGEHVIEK